MCKLHAACFFIAVSKLTLGESTAGCLTQWCGGSKHLNIQLPLFENCTAISKVHSLLGKLGLKVLLQMTDSASSPSVFHSSHHWLILHLDGMTKFYIVCSHSKKKYCRYCLCRDIKQKKKKNFCIKDLFFQDHTCKYGPEPPLTDVSSSGRRIKL